MVQLSHQYMTTGKPRALDIWTFVGKVMSLLFNMLPRFIIANLPRSKHLLVLWLQSPSAVILELKKIKSVTVPTCSPSICHEVMGPDAVIWFSWWSRAFICYQSPSYDLIESRVPLASFFSSNIRGGEGRRENQSESRRLFHMNLKKSSNNRDFLQILPFCTYFQTSIFLLFLPYTFSFFICIIFFFYI